MAAQPIVQPVFRHLNGSRALTERGPKPPPQAKAEFARASVNGCAEVGAWYQHRLSDVNKGCKSGGQSDGDLDDRQMPVAAIVRAADLDLRLTLVACADRNRRRQHAALPCFFRCPSLQGGVCAMFVEPGSEVVAPTLNPFLREAGRDQSAP